MRTIMAICLLAFVSSAQAIDWPANYVIAEDSTSPDEHYAVLIPSQESAQGDDKRSINYLVDVRAHRVLAAIDKSDYFERQGHRSLNVNWADDSSWAMIDYDARFGMDSFTLLELTGKSLKQTDLGVHIAKVTPNFTDASIYSRLSPDRKLRVRAISTTDPKELEPKGGQYSLFQGTYDVKSDRWTVEDGRKLTYDQYSALDDAYDVAEVNVPAYPDMAGKLSYFDHKLNAVYGALRALLPPERFAKIKAEQIAWLKQRDAAASDEERVRLIHDRVEHLQDLLW